MIKQRAEWVEEEEGEEESIGRAQMAREEQRSEQISRIESKLASI